jgi:DnaJ-class molecular chaperone
MSTAEQARAAIARFVEQAYAQLEQVDYYRILGVSSAATEEQIRGTYYKLAAKLHPDIHGDGVDAGFHARLTAVFSRVVEAYKVLSDEKKRRQYDDGLAQGMMRLRVGAKARPRTAEDQLTNPKAKKFFKLGQSALTSKNYSSAVMNFKMALSMEPDSEVIQRFLEQAEDLAK